MISCDIVWAVILKLYDFRMECFVQILFVGAISCDIVWEVILKFKWEDEPGKRKCKFKQIYNPNKISSIRGGETPLPDPPNFKTSS